MRTFILLCVLLFVSVASAQTRFTSTKKVTLKADKDTLSISPVSIAPIGFIVKHKSTEVPASNYTVDYEKALLTIDAKNYDELEITYTAYPEFLTKTYQVFDKKYIVENNKTTNLFKIRKKNAKEYKPFEGLNTQGSLARGVQIGNSQDAVTNSSLDLQIDGKLSNNVRVRASISDSNIPIQNNGYSQQIQEFDRVFIELYSKKWGLKAGDINLSNKESHFLKFNKKVSGLSLDIHPKDDKDSQHFKASGALVRGRFARNQFNGIDGNQGPYQLNSPNGERFIVLLSGSETIYNNGRKLKRGAQHDYTIDYNTAQITFTTTFPISSSSRITAEFQYSDRNYTRFVSYNKAVHKDDKIEIAGYFYTESDAKNQPLQQELSETQKQTLSEAGDDASKMFAESAYPQEYDSAKILYAKIPTDTGTFFEFSQDSSKSLFAVSFSYVGTGKGAYIIKETTAIGKIFEYTGAQSGDYAPLSKLAAPDKLQIAVSTLKYNPNNKTNLQAEVAFSNKDQNLFSNKDDADNTGAATKIAWKQTYTDKKWLVQTEIDVDYLDADFKSIERIYNVEFNRDWNLQNPEGNQKFIQSKLKLSNKKNTTVSYGYQNLSFGSSFQGYKHLLQNKITTKNTKIRAAASFLKNNSTTENSLFNKTSMNIHHNLKKSWLQGFFNSENNQRTDKITQNISLLSQKQKSYGASLGVGDSTKVYLKVGAKWILNDSVRNEKLQRVAENNSYFIKSKLLQNKKAQVQLFAAYTEFKNYFTDNYSALNSRVTYAQKLWGNFVKWTTVYETAAGTSPKQEFSYIKTEPGQGYYTWIDYNENGIQEFEEFEIAKFSDQASYLRVALPSLGFVRVNKTLFSHSLHLNPSQWAQSTGFKKIAAQFSNQTYILVDTDTEKNSDKIQFNPFDTNNPKVRALKQTFRNAIYFRRGLQQHSTTYTYAHNKTKNNLGIGFIENENTLQQLMWQHKIAASWLLSLDGKAIETKNTTENFEDRSYQIDSKEFKPELTFKLKTNSNLAVNYEYKDKQDPSKTNVLQVQKLGATYQFSSLKKGALFIAYDRYQNSFSGIENTPLSYQMLEGLQVGKNSVWTLTAQKKLTAQLHLNINYTGRNSENNTTLHTGSIQLRALF